MHRSWNKLLMLVTSIMAVVLLYWPASAAPAPTAIRQSAEVDSAGGTPAIALRVTVADSNICGDSDSVTVNPGTDVWLCYAVTNTGNKTLRYHNLSDALFGTILDHQYYELLPGKSFQLVKGPFLVQATVSNTATWSARRYADSPLVTANASATISAKEIKPAVVNVSHFAPFAKELVGTSVSVLVNGQVALENFEFGSIQQNIELPAGEYEIAIVPTGATEPAITGKVKVEAGKNYTLAAIGDVVNQPLELFVLVNAEEKAASGALVRASHLAPFAKDINATGVDICTDDNQVVVSHLKYKQSTDYLNLPAGDYNLKIALADSSCQQVALDLPSLRFSDGEIVDLFAIGDIVNQPLQPAAIPGITPTPSKKAKVTIAVDAQPDSIRNFRFDGDLGKFRLDDSGADDGDAYASSKSFDVDPGSYKIVEQVPHRWHLANIQCNAGNVVVDLANSSLTIDVAAGDDIFCTFVNQRTGIIRINKYNDLNGDGVRKWEPSLRGWEFTLSDVNGNKVDSQITNNHGKASFVNLVPGVYNVCEMPQAGWTNTQPGGDACYTVQLTPKQVVTLYFGNTDQPANSAVKAARLDGVEVHSDDYQDYDDEAYFPEGASVDADLAVPAISGRIYLPAVGR